MSRSGHSYPLGPFEAFLLERQGGQNTIEKEDETIACRSNRNRKLQSGGFSYATLDHHKVLFSGDELMLEEQQYERELEKINQKISIKEQLIAEHKQALEEEEYVLEGLYGSFDSLRKKRSQIMRQRMGGKRQNKLFCSHEAMNTGKVLESVLPDNYQPSPGVVEMLTEYRHIPLQFIQDKLVEFKIYYADTQERRTAWDRTFYHWVVNGWKRDKHKEAVSDTFHPDKASLEELTSEKIDAKFCQSEIRKFILYWQEQKATFTPKLWQERFRQWVRRAWQRNKANEDNSRPSYPATEEFADTERADKYQFSFEE